MFFFFFFSKVPLIFFSVLRFFPTFSFSHTGLLLENSNTNEVKTMIFSSMTRTPFYFIFTILAPKKRCFLILLRWFYLFFSCPLSSTSPAFVLIIFFSVNFFLPHYLVFSFRFWFLLSSPAPPPPG